MKKEEGGHYKTENGLYSAETNNQQSICIKIENFLYYQVLTLC